MPELLSAEELIFAVVCVVVSPDTPVSETDCCCDATELNESAELLVSTIDGFTPNMAVCVFEDTAVSEVDCC